MFLIRSKLKALFTAFFVFKLPINFGIKIFLVRLSKNAVNKFFPDDMEILSSVNKFLIFRVFIKKIQHIQHILKKKQIVLVKSLCHRLFYDGYKKIFVQLKLRFFGQKTGKQKS